MSYSVAFLLFNTASDSNLWRIGISILSYIFIPAQKLKTLQLNTMNDSPNTEGQYLAAHFFL
jgi:hypothetical protein